MNSLITTKPWLVGVTAEDMPNDDLKFIAESVGIEAALALILCAPGLTVTIPKNPLKALKDKYIIANYNGSKYSINELAIQCEVTQRYIYNLINQHLKNVKTTYK